MENNLNLMRIRLNFFGGASQHNRMVKDKERTLEKVLLYSYQAAFTSTIPYELTRLIEKEKVKKLTKTEEVLKEQLLREQTTFKSLINPNKIKQDYDDKVISTLFSNNLKNGDIVKWQDTNTYWLVSLQQLSEEAYFRSEVRRCRYIISWIDEAGNFQCSWVAIRGPVETKINDFVKTQMTIDIPNLTLNFLMPKNEHTMKAFKRYKRFLLDGTAWEVQTHNSISSEGIIEVTAMEHYLKDSDDLINNLENGLAVKPIDPNPEALEGELNIEGETFIRPKTTYEYKIINLNPDIVDCHWEVSTEGNKVVFTSCDYRQCQIKWDKVKSGKFDLEYRQDNNALIFKKTIIVESLF